MLQLYDSDGNSITEPGNFCGTPGCLGEPWCSAWGICEDTGVGWEMDNYDELFEMLSQQLEFESTSEMQSAPPPVNTSPTQSAPPAVHFSSTAHSSSQSSSTRQFAQVRTDEEVELARTTGIPTKTKQDTKYCTDLWNAWTSYRERQSAPDRLYVKSNQLRHSARKSCSTGYLEVNIVLEGSEI